MKVVWMVCTPRLSQPWRPLHVSCFSLYVRRNTQSAMKSQNKCIYSTYHPSSDFSFTSTSKDPAKDSYVDVLI